MAVAVFVAGVLAAIPPSPAFAAPSQLPLDISFSFGSLAAEFNIMNPVGLPSGVFRSTLHIHVRDDSQTPSFNADLVAIGNAANADALLGGFLPAAIIVKNDLLAGMTFQQASVDAQTKTGVTVTFFNDATMSEYALLLFLICVNMMSGVGVVSPQLQNDACQIKSNLLSGMAALGIQNPPDGCVIP